MHVSAPNTKLKNRVMIFFAPFFYRAIKIGKMSQTPSQILENLRTALPAVASAVKGGWDNIQNFAIKTNSSVSLPIWSCTLSITEGGGSSSLQAEDAEKEDEDVEKEEEEEEKAAKEQASRKARKRATNPDEEAEEVEKPRKRSKAADGMVRGASISKKKKVEKEAEETEEEEEEKTAKDRASRKGGKRVTTSDEELEEVEKPRKRSKAVDGMVRGLSISKKEMRQKRSANTGEKKKRIVLTSKGSKSMKNAVLGKKVRTSQIRP